MCGRFTLAVPAEQVATQFKLSEQPSLSARFNIAPTQQVAAVRADDSGRSLDMLRWGLVPSWAKDLAIGAKMINARSETAAEKPAFRSAMKQRRCLIPADGFYEWKKLPDSKRKQPYFISRPDGERFAFAGLWEVWRGPKDAEGNRTEDPLRSCTIRVSV